MPKLLTMLVAVVLGGCGGIVIDAPDADPPMLDADDAAPEADRDPCVYVARPVWCQADAHGWRCQAKGTPREAGCANIVGDAAADPRWCC